MASDMSPADYSHAVGGLNVRCASTMLMVDSHDTGDGDPCRRTFLLPISLTGQMLKAGYSCEFARLS
jgi:hypothetical protein